MSNWRLYYERNQYDIDIILNGLFEDFNNEQIYFHCLTFLKLKITNNLIKQIENLFEEHYIYQSLSQTDFLQFQENLIKSIPYYQNDNDEFIEGIILLFKYFSSKNQLQICQTMLQHKIILQKHNQILSTLIIQVIQQEEYLILYEIIKFLGQKQLKSYQHQLLQQIIKLDSEQQNIFLKFMLKILTQYIQSITENNNQFDYFLEKNKIYKIELIYCFKRLLKWDKINYQFIIEKLDIMLQNNDKIKDKELLNLILLIITSEQSSQYMKHISLIKLVKNQQKLFDLEFYLQRICKFMRINNYKDIDYSYRMGYNGLQGNNIDSFRLAQDFEKDILKMLQDSQKLEILLKQIIKTFIREPYSFSYQFIEQIIMFNYEQETSIYNLYWSLITKIYQHFFIQLYDSNIINMYDYKGQFVDDLGKTKLVTKIGNLKKYARNLIPLIQQLIINSYLILNQILKKFTKLFLSENSFYNFILNFIYEPQQQKYINCNFLKQDQTNQLQQLLPTILQQFQLIKQEYEQYLNDIINLLDLCEKEKTSEIYIKFNTILKKINNSKQLLPKYNIFNLKKVHEQIQQEINLNKNGIILTLNVAKSIALKNSFQLLIENNNQPFQQIKSNEFSYFIKVIKSKFNIQHLFQQQNQYPLYIQPISQSILTFFLEFKFNCYINNEAQNFIFNLLDNNLEKIGQQQYENNKDDKENLPEKMIECIDKQGDIYYNIEQQINIKKITKMYTCPNYKAYAEFIIYLKLIQSIILSQNNYQFNIEEIIEKLLIILKKNSLEYDGIIYIFDICCNIIEQLNNYTSEKWYEKQYNKSIESLKKQQSLAITQSIIIDILITQKSLQFNQIDFGYLIYLCSTLNNSEQKKSLLTIICKNYNNYNDEIIQQINYTQQDQIIKQICLPFLLKSLKNKNDIICFNNILNMFLTSELNNIKICIIEFITSNLKELGLRYLIILIIGALIQNTKIKKIVKLYLDNLNSFLQIENAYDKFFLTLNSSIYLIANQKNEINQIQAYWFIRKSLKYLIPQKIKNSTKKLISLYQLSQQMIIQLSNTIPIQNEFSFQIFSYFKINQQKLPDSIINTNKQIENFQQIIDLFRQCIQDQLMNSKKLLDINKKESQIIIINFVDSLLFQKISEQIQDNENQSKIQGKRSQILSQISPIHFYSEKKGTKRKEKILKVLDDGLQKIKK